MAAAERSRSPVRGGSPVPACMFAPEPGSPGGRPRVAAAACPLRAAFDGEDGEALNGEPEIDLTSKVGPAGGRAAAGAITPPGPRCSPPCRSAVPGGLPPQPGLFPHLRRVRGWGPPTSAGTGRSPERSPGPSITWAGGRASGAVWRRPERRSKVVPYPAGTGGCWQAAPPCAFPASAARGERQPAVGVASSGSAGFGAVSCCNVPLTFALRAGSL